MGLFKKEASYDYFGGFLRIARVASSSARFVRETFCDFEATKLPDKVREIHELENEADELKHEMMRRLAREFIPPIELEDVAALAHELDNIVDAIEDVLRRVYVFDVHTLKPEAVEFSELIVSCCEAFESVMEEFVDFKKSKAMGEMIIQVNTLESEGDKLHERALRRLFTGDANARELLVWMNVFEALESSLDAIEHAADIVESVVMKNT